MQIRHGSVGARETRSGSGQSHGFFKVRRLTAMLCDVALLRNRGHPVGEVRRPSRPTPQGLGSTFDG
jgi:hypothetical protein